MLFDVLGVLCGLLLALAVQSSQAFAASWARGAEPTLPANRLSYTDVQVRSVSCASPGNCSAVGYYYDSSHSQQGVLLTESAGRWAPGVEASLPPNAGSIPNVSLNAVSCASAGDCTAVGTYHDSSGREQGLLVTQSGGTWTPGVEAILPANAIPYPLAPGPYLGLGSVSCASPGNCSAVGYYYDSSRRQQGVLLTETNGAWAPGVEATLPPNAGSYSVVSLSSVSCASAGNCTAVGSYTDGSRNSQGLLLTETNGTWAPGVEATLPTNGGSNPIFPASVVPCVSAGTCAIASSVSCASAGNCSAVGTYIDSSGSPRGLLLAETNGTWAPGVEAAAPGNAESLISSVSCASAGNCSAVGGYGVFNDANYHADYSRGLLLSETDGTWAPGVEATPPVSALDMSLGSVSCASADNCSAVGGYEAPISPDYYSHGVLVSETGGTWAPGVEATPPVNAASRANVALSSVSCAPEGNYCSAVGSYTDSSGQQQVLLVSTAAVLTSLRVSPKTFVLSGRRVNGRCVKRTAKNRTHRPCIRPVTVSVSYQLDFPAPVTITIKRVLPGRLSKGRCVAPTHKNRTHRRCTQLVALRGSLTKNGAQGSNSFRWGGRIGGHKLAAGTYQLTAAPAGGSTRTVTFRIAG